MPEYARDKRLAKFIRRTEDSFLIKGVSFAVIVDKTGFLPFHHTGNSKKLTGDLKKDILGCRTNRRWAYLGKEIDPDRIKTSPYLRDTGTLIIIGYAPIKLKGKFWGGVIFGYKVMNIQKQIYSMTSYVILLLIVLTISIFVLLNILIRRSLRPINRISDILLTVAKGDFSNTIDYTSDDEIGVIAASLNTMINMSAGTINYMQKAATSLAATSEELTATSMTLGKSSSEQAESIRNITVELNLILESIHETTEYIGEQVSNISNTAESINNLEDMSKKIAKNMNRVKKQSDESIGVSESGRELVQAASDAMN